MNKDEKNKTAFFIDLDRVKKVGSVGKCKSFTNFFRIKAVRWTYLIEPKIRGSISRQIKGRLIVCSILRAAKKGRLINVQFA